MIHIKNDHLKKEPVFIKNDQGELKFDFIATRSCKLIVYNAIATQCREDPLNITVWVFIRNFLSTAPHDRPVKINEIHDKIFDILHNSANFKVYKDIVAKVLIEVNNNLYIYLDETEIADRLYLSYKTYRDWIDYSLAHPQ